MVFLMDSLLFPQKINILDILHYTFFFFFQYKLCKVKKVSVGPKGVPFLVTSDGRTIRYPDPLVKVNDSILYDLEKGKMKDFIKFDSGY